MSKAKRRSKQYTNRQASRSPLVPQTETQQDYIDAIRYNDQVICLGPAGTGKTYIPAVLAADALMDKSVDQVILTRPNVGAGDSIGYFPGTLEEKMAPWVAPFTDVMRQRMGEGSFEYHMGKKIKIVPLETIRGASFENSFIILDEAQNCTLHQLKAFLTRQAEGSTCVINGDVRQSDLKQGSGLSRLIQILHKRRVPVPVIEFGVDDIVRSGICREWVIAFMEEGL